MTRLAVSCSSGERSEHRPVGDWGQSVLKLRGSKYSDGLICSFSKLRLSVLMLKLSNFFLDLIEAYVYGVAVPKPNKVFRSWIGYFLNLFDGLYHHSKLSIRSLRPDSSTHIQLATEKLATWFVFTSRTRHPAGQTSPGSSPSQFLHRIKASPPPS